VPATRTRCQQPLQGLRHKKRHRAVARSDPPRQWVVWSIRMPECSTTSKMARSTNCYSPRRTRSARYGSDIHGGSARACLQLGPASVGSPLARYAQRFGEPTVLSAATSHLPTPSNRRFSPFNKPSRSPLWFSAASRPPLKPRSRSLSFVGHADLCGRCGKRVYDRG
jgi:hypothetical protein